MPNPVAVVRTVNYTKPGEKESRPAYKSVVVWCPGCKYQHRFTVEVYDNYSGRPNDEPEPIWQWDGNLESPTFSPSLLCYDTVHLCELEHTYTECKLRLSECEHKSHGYAWIFPDGMQRTFKVYEKKPKGVKQITFGESSPHPREPAFGNCHSFLKNGVWEFLSDSAHHLAGQNVPLEPLPDWMVGKDAY